MSATWIAHDSANGRLSMFGTLQQRHALWWQTALVFAAIVIVCGALSLFDDRTFNGISVWSKPFKFALSIAVYFATLAWFAPLLPNGYLEARKGRWLTMVPVACAVLEMIYIIVQASRAEASHFNLSTPFYSVMYALMGMGAVAMVAICLWMGIVILRSRGTESPYTFAVGIGLVLTFVLGGGFGGYLAEHMSHWVGGTQSDTNGMALMKWSRDGGDLRVAHFFGMHAMQLLPLFAALLPNALPRRTAIGVVIGAACLYAAGTTFTFVQALNGVPFI